MDDMRFVSLHPTLSLIPLNYTIALQSKTFVQPITQCSSDQLKCLNLFLDGGINFYLNVIQEMFTFHTGELLLLGEKIV